MSNELPRSTDVKTMPTNGILINFPAIDEVIFTQKFLSNNLKFMHLKDLSNGQIENVPPVIGAHPLAVIGDDKNNLAKLPMIGVEQTTGVPEEIQLGLHQSKKYAMTQEWLDKLGRIPTDERMFPQSLLDNIQRIYSDRKVNDVPLYLHANSVIEETGVQISAWTADYEQTRILKKVMKSLMIEFYRGIKAYGVHPLKYTLEPSLYSWTAGELLFGAEITLPFMMRNMNYIIDVDLQEIKGVDVGIFGSEDGKSLLFFRPMDIEEGIMFGGKEVKYGTKEEILASE